MTAATTAPSFPMARGACPFDPPPAVEDLRAARPVGRVTTWDGRTPWLVTRHADVRAALSDPRLSADVRASGYPLISPARAGLARRTTPSFIVMDDPGHARLRRMLISDFTVRNTEALRPMVTGIVDELLDALAAGPRPADLVTAFALPLPSMVICRMLGVPYADHELFQGLAARMLSSAHSPEVVFAASEQLREYLRGLVERRRTEPSDDLLGRLVTRRVGSGELSVDEAVSMASLLLVAGHETTAN